MLLLMRPKSWAATSGLLKHRCMQAAAARLAASNSRAVLMKCASFAKGMLGTQLVTHQSGPEGLPVNVVYVESGSDIDRELYLSMLVDREVSRVAFIASAAGGMDIEKVAEETPEKIFTVAIAPDAGLQDYQARQLAFGLGLDKKQMRQFGDLVKRLYRLFDECDASLVEINPLIVTKAGDVSRAGRQDQYRQQCAVPPTQTCRVA